MKLGRLVQSGGARASPAALAGWNATSVAVVISKLLISKTTQHRYFPHNLSHHY